VIREDRFLISRRPYAVDLSSLTVDEPGPLGWCWGHVNAVWFRRKNGVTAACVGTMRNYQRPAPGDITEFLTEFTDGRYGGNCEGRWDGTGYWGAENPETIAAHLELLRPMLAAYPAIPAGYDGWWRF
jgi:hypothetical protein